MTTPDSLIVVVESAESAASAASVKAVAFIIATALEVAMPNQG